MVYCAKCGMLNPYDAASCSNIEAPPYAANWRTGCTIGVNIAIATLTTNMVTIEESPVALDS